MVLAAFFVLSGAGASYAFRPASNAGGGTVTGELIIKGVGPMTSSTIFFIDEAQGIPPSSTKYWLVPTYAFNVDKFSRFSANLPEGTYYVGALDRNLGEFLGHPEEGDYFFISRDSKGNPKKLTVWRNSTIDLGRIEDAAPFKSSSLETKGITAVQGVIQDVHGRPIQGMVVMAYSAPDMMGRPLFVSGKTGPDGQYLLRVNKGGSYYLMSRQLYSSGTPADDELLGFYKDGKPVKVKTGATAKGIKIVVWPGSMYE